MVARIDFFFSMNQLLGMCNDLWSAGMETTVTTMRWGALFMIHNPDVQAKVQAEIDEYMGDSDRDIVMSDKNSLPYTSATINVSYNFFSFRISGKGRGAMCNDDKKCNFFNF